MTQTTLKTILNDFFIQENVMSIVFNTVNSIGITFGFSNRNTEYPSYIEKIFKEKYFQGEGLEFLPTAQGSGISWTYQGGIDSSQYFKNMSNLLDKTLLSKPVMQCKDGWGYKGIALHIKGRACSKKIISLVAKHALIPLEGVSCFSDALNAPAAHTGEAGHRKSEQLFETISL